MGKKTHSRQFGHSLRKSFQFGRQQSLPAGQAIPTQQQSQQQQIINTIAAVRPGQHPPLGSLQKYQIYHPGLPPTMIQSSGMPQNFYYSIPPPGSTALARAPPTPVMQTRSFQRTASVSGPGQQPPLQQQQLPQQTSFSPAYITTTVQPLPPPGRGVLLSYL